mmetsp:Transcript_10032/g.25027  ORF Transcript_10032/g.25027 Transcript_10032/m.25027 type:complete len:266 (+) Transcript_10032:656-1453(+)
MHQRGTNHSTRCSTSPASWQASSRCQLSPAGRPLTADAAPTTAAAGLLASACASNTSSLGAPSSKGVPPCPRLRATIACPPRASTVGICASMRLSSVRCRSTRDFLTDKSNGKRKTTQSNSGPSARPGSVAGSDVASTPNCTTTSACKRRYCRCGAALGYWRSSTSALPSHTVATRLSRGWSSGCNSCPPGGTPAVEVPCGQEDGASCVCASDGAVRWRCNATAFERSPSPRRSQRLAGREGWWLAACPHPSLPDIARRCTNVSL